MKINSKIIVLALLVSGLISCNTNEKADGYGNFETTEITVSAENNGKLLQFELVEGALLKKEAFVGYIDTIPLTLKKDQLQISKEIVYSKSKGVLSQISVLKAELKTAQISKKRIENLLKENAGTQQQLDAINGKIDVLNQQIRSIKIQNASVVNELKSIDIQLLQLEDQLQKNIIINPVSGTVLAKYAEPNEIVSFGKPLYKIADLTTMQLRVYVSETQLATIKIGQKVTIKIDSTNTMKNYTGTISWIASEAEFTPKIIQTKEERVNLVYAVKIDVKNDDSLKIGMPAELWLNPSEN
ncbi:MULTISPECIES: HlyD family secretion protein [Flavobacteriaceae]|uniref:HlyD family efflux transporter periplasmic adaptor subunit n=2 Tax=Flavobacteriaceae TaxID=49546 RepID=A0A4Y8ASE5_9FLAO|nr:MULTISPECIES: HlyD family efflux transporter periplasmic adaptor subunit [Flavobacteriaceae]TEW73739.1 HlyD family efflux transporter periplasmic adaptor subunit [Gramella jeungdoensis]GGK37150.1 membrane protein [Lutibacter litoralis]